MLAILKSMDIGLSWVIVLILVLGSFFQSLNNGIINFESAGSLLALLAYTCLSYKEGAKRYLKDLENVVNPRKKGFFDIIFIVSFIYLLLLSFYAAHPSYIVYARSISVLLVISISASCVYMLTTNQFKVNKGVIFIGKTSGVIYPGGVISINLLKPESFEILNEKFELEPFEIGEQGIRFKIKARCYIDIGSFQSSGVSVMDMGSFMDKVGFAVRCDTESIFSQCKTITEETLHGLKKETKLDIPIDIGVVKIRVQRTIEF